MNEENGEVKKVRVRKRARQRLRQLRERDGEFGIQLSWVHFEFTPEFLEDLADLFRGRFIHVGMIWLSTLEEEPAPRINYWEYLHSQGWAQRRLEALDAADHRCQVCNTDQAPLQVHHRTYKNLGHERPTDLLVLCRDCHRLFHDHGKLAKPPAREE